MEELTLKCWNGIYGCSSFEIIGWKYDFSNIHEAQKYYSDIWAKCWIEDLNGNIVRI